MFSSLRVRLFASYLFLLLVTLSAIAAAVIFISNTRAAPPQPTYDRLLGVALGLPLRDIYGAGRPGLPARRLETLRASLQTMAEDRDLRMLIVSRFSRVVLYDSAGRYSEGMVLEGEFDDYAPAPVGGWRGQALGAVRGRFTDPALPADAAVPADAALSTAEWLFIGLESIEVRGSNYLLLLAEPRPVQTLQSALAEFGTDLLPLFLQAAAVGVVIAVVLAAAIARSIVYPLGALAQAAGRAASQIRTGAITPLQVSGTHEIRVVAEAFNQMVAEVHAEQKSQHDFMANVSHDLKTPLTSIQGFSQAIIDEAAPDPVKAAQVIHDEAARMTRMVSELTDLARLQSGRFSMQMTPIDLGGLATAIAGRLSLAAHEKEIALSIDAPHMPPVAGDGDRLAQVLTNLIGNAIKYTPAGGSVWVRAQPREGGVEVLVQDNGIGIEEGELARIFERFYQVDKARGPRRGTGLGLAIVREIVSAHGGRIQVTSAGKGQGAQFVVWFPAVRAA
jgi:signal transduction histidine kinase